MKISAIIEDITKLNVNVIVNAANNSLLGGGGVDGAIHRAAGYKLLEECKTLNGCSTGEAKITKGYNLPAKYVIHTVGPIYKGGGNNEDIFLKKCYINSLKLAENFKLNSIAFPSISTGVYRYPVKEAAFIAVNTVNELANSLQYVQKAIFCCFDSNTYSIYNNLLNNKL